MKRSQPSLNLPQAPLAYVVAQVRTSAVVSLEKFIPDVQEQLRHSGFPKFQDQQVQEILIQPNTAPDFKSFRRWEFQNKASTIGIVVATDFVLVHTTAYSTFEDLEQWLALALSTVGDSVGISLVERVGLRYVNLIKPAAGRELESYLHPGLVGLDGSFLGLRNTLNRCQFSGETDIGKLVVRCTQLNDGTSLPPDIKPMTLRPKMVAQPGERVCLLEFDHFSDRSSDYDLPATLDSLWELHGTIELAFKHSVTPDAMRLWANNVAQQAQ